MRGRNLPLLPAVVVPTAERGLLESTAIVRVSIVIPQHNRSELTVNAVRSLLEFHERSFEILIVDDGSSGKHRTALRNLRGTGVHFVLSHCRRGVTAAWNLGAAAASGETLVFLNNDTVSEGPWVEQLVSPLATDDVLMTGVEVRREPLAQSRSFDQLLAGWGFALRRDVLLRMGGFDPQLKLYFSDTDLQFRIAQQGPLITGVSLDKSSHGLSAQLRVVEGLPLRHLGHCSTRQLSSRSAEWRRDRCVFCRKWQIG